MVGQTVPQKPKRYESVAQALSAEIQAGRYSVGTFLPTEAELCSKFAVSRITVREALRQLEERQLIVKEHGLGSRVVAREDRSVFTISLDTVTGSGEWGTATTLAIQKIEHIPAEGNESAKLGLQEGAVKLSGVRLRVDGPNEPLAYFEIYISSEYGSVITESNRPNEQYYRSICRLFGQNITRIEQEVSAIPLPLHQAKALGRRKGEPGLHVIRKFYGNDSRIIEVTINVHVANDFKLEFIVDKNRP